MSIYHKVDAAALEQCLDSLARQTRQPDQFVIVKDGPLGDELELLLSEFQHNHNVRFVTFPVNQGLIEALNAGIPCCDHEWIIRMDADDIATPDRIAAQLGWLEAHPDIDVLGSSMLEFSADPTKPDRLKPALATHEEIINGLPFRNPINHPTACIRRSLLKDGYPHLQFLEDYFLWCHLHLKGARFHNLTKPYYLFRFDDQTLERRAGTQNLRNEIQLRRWMYRNGMMRVDTLLFVVLLQFGLRLMPQSIRRWLWHRSRQPVE